ncbi:hypothetical protein, partial [Escherichia coli]|uniref:hypothetical protein n=1 Tax=Escherichia coli TaxID=562 RepID=UPI0012FE369E
LLPRSLPRMARLPNRSNTLSAHGQDTTSKITNVKDADLTADSTDAVNGSQLKTTNDAVATNTTNIANNTSNIATNTTNISNLTETVTNLG